MKGNGAMSGIYAFSVWIMRFSSINILWFLINLPIVFILINILYLKQMEYLIVLLIPLIVLLPGLFFPATTAMFASTRSWVINEDEQSLIKPYLRYFKENFKNSFLGGILVTGLWFILGIDFYYFSEINSVLMYSFILFGVLLYVFTINFFSTLVHYNMKLLSILKYTLLATIGSPLLSFSVLISNGAIIYISVTNFSFLIPFFTGSLIAFLSFSAFYRMFLNSIKKQSQDADK
ncbi:YesL family protein [Gracilibacillus massiliensis]|uniref:YesL family protein n=1 Tax=Gracilibacillus massiliensis TaxID=1564956 RepID=UPI00097C08E5|nr:DUF624 domain-containing protein [Gracilibacillus massiliensis]